MEEDFKTFRSRGFAAGFLLFFEYVSAHSMFESDRLRQSSTLTFMNYTQSTLKTQKKHFYIGRKPCTKITRRQSNTPIISTQVGGHSMVYLTTHKLE